MRSSAGVEVIGVLGWRLLGDLGSYSPESIINGSIVLSGPGIVIAGGICPLKYGWLIKKCFKRCNAIFNMFKYREDSVKPITHNFFWNFWQPSSPSPQLYVFFL